MASAIESEFHECEPLDAFKIHFVHAADKEQYVSKFVRNKSVHIFWRKSATRHRNVNGCRFQFAKYVDVYIFDCDDRKENNGQNCHHNRNGLPQCKSD